MTPLLIHKLTCFESIIRQIIMTSDVRVVAEIGAETGETTKFLHDQLSRRNSSFEIYSIDPNPSEEFQHVIAELQNVRWIRKLSHAAIPELPRVDLMIVDGDHNYWTVLNELNLIEENSIRDGNRPLILLHDVCWPCARRDLYYNPAIIPAEFLRPHSFDAGLTLGSKDHLINRGFRSNGSFAAALEEGGERNGVLTAVEDFLAANPGFDFHVVPAVFGLGLMVHREHPKASELRQLLAPFHENSLLHLLEQNRLQNYLHTIELQDQMAEDATIRVRLWQDQEAKHEAEIQDYKLKDQEKNRQLTDLTNEVQALQAFSARLVAGAGMLSDRYAKLYVELRRLKQPNLLPGRSNEEIIAQSIFFDEQYYRENNKSVNFNQISPARHYLQVGEAARRRPSLIFDPMIYIGVNRIKERPENALLHYETIGRKKGLLPFAIRYIEPPQMALEAPARNDGRIHGTIADAETASFAAIRNAVDDHDVISFDVFDTLLVRDVAQPAAVFLLVAAETGIADFKHRRIFAEKLARERSQARTGTSEISLDDIYDSIELSPEHRAQAKASELAWERQVLRAYPSARKIYDYAKSLSKRIVAISDMYLDGETIEDLLQANGILVERVHSSSDYRSKNLAKHNGRIFGYVADILPADKSQILHVGDNFRSDVINARSHGLTALKSRIISEDIETWSGINSRTINLLREGDNLTGSLIVGMLSRRADAGLLQPDSLQGFGYVYGGAIVAAFVKFLSGFSRTKGISNFLLFTRDGYVIEDAMAKLGFTDAQFRLMHMSRQMAALGGLRVAEQLSLSRLFPKRKSYGLREELERIGVQTDVPDLHFEDREAFMSSIRLYCEELFNGAAERADVLKAYIRHLTGNGSIEKIAFVDVGWFLSSHRIIDLLLEDKVKGAYIGVHSHAYDNGNVSGMFFDSNDRSLQDIMMKGTEIIEFVFSHPSRSVRGLRIQDGAFQPDFQEETKHDRIRNAYVRDMRSGLSAFLDDIRPYFHLLSTDEVIKLAKDMWSNLIQHPSRPEWQQLGGVPHALETGHSNFKTIAEYWDPKRLQGGR